ncbi:MAG: LysR family transcriptional regulator [Paludibacterium sp.]|uniref:LysR family transcriptional regulator n=1 Tax=Paludibacterium sp. TaxID=1917523 RepID=UPI0025E4D9E4|nr:LysR family transcriptional regulator [Paludibacterium sp.]MBV8046680.1 LysR family transcriptional regulator [Paludibacterium sp.]MBV8649591.1 LysR family transcriptional regulator [Paludibacterium sp.]
MNLPKTRAAQWRMLQAVVDLGGFAQAASALHRSQSSISHAVATLQQQLGVAILVPEGRRMVLTPDGAALLRDARQWLSGLERLEARAMRLRDGWESEVRLAVDSLFPSAALLRILRQFAAGCGDTRLQLHEVVMSGADDALYGGQVDLAIATRVPSGFLGDWLFDAAFQAVAAPSHPLFSLERAIDADDLAGHTQVVVRDSGGTAPRDAGWLGARQRWTVSKQETSLAAVLSGLAYAWLPTSGIASALADGRLMPLPLSSGGMRKMPVYLIVADPAVAGPATLQLAQWIRAEGDQLSRI